MFNFSRPKEQNKKKTFHYNRESIRELFDSHEGVDKKIIMYSTHSINEM